MILAGIDIGTNTLRLLIAEIGPSTYREIRSERRITRLGLELDRTGLLSRKDRERSLVALAEFSELIKQHAVLHVAAVGTSALRNAANSREFLDEAKQRTGIDIRVITGREEARLALRGVALMLRDTGRGSADPLASAVIIDIGGGSTEIIVTHPKGEPDAMSLPLGAVYLTERFIQHDPPTGDEINRLRRSVREGLASQRDLFHPDPARIFVGTAGTITTLAAVNQGLAEYDPEKINRFVMTRKFIDDIILKLGSLTLEQRRAIRGLEPGREDIILAGAIVAQEIMESFLSTSMLVSDWGLREGIVFDLYDKMSKAHRA
jgi:exopolyphosphatase/guanosine-5'-triphosphate,3'-diphosphate pyrophosphatase